jgi:starch phosphorylase
VHYDNNAELRQVLEMIGFGFFSVEEPDRYRVLYDNLTKHGDHYMLQVDYASYIATQEQVGALYRDQEEWTRRAILNVARMGKFSSDRTIREYADKVWKVKHSQSK